MGQNKRRGFRLFLYLWLVWGVAASWPAITAAHSSGAPRLADVAAGPYRLWVWSLPDPIRVGETHMSVAVGEPEANTAQQKPAATALDVQFIISAVDRPDQQFTQQASKEERFLQTYYESDFTMPAIGQWRAVVSVTGPAGVGAAEFTFAVLPPQRVNWELVIGGGVALLAAVWVLRTNPNAGQQKLV